jgi:phosphoserine phosphatase
MDRENAVKINELIEKMIGIANQVMYITNNAGDEENKKRVQKALGTAITELDLDVLEPIYKQFPDLRPDGLEEIKENS